LPEIILLNVRWCCRYALSYRNLEAMVQERGVEWL
jgi:transposase-like protein